MECHPRPHYVLSESMSDATKRRICDGLARNGDAVPESIPRQMAKMYERNGMDLLEIEFAATPMQVNGFECGDLAIARAFDLVDREFVNLSLAEYAPARQLRMHTALIMLSGEVVEYPKAQKLRGKYTVRQAVQVQLLTCCGMPKQQEPIVKCNKCSADLHAHCEGVSQSVGIHDFVCTNCSM